MLANLHVVLLKNAVSIILQPKLGNFKNSEAQLKIKVF